METIIHKLRRIVESSISDPDIWKNKAVLKVDLQNAFNNISRSAFLKIVQYCLPSLFPFISSCYESPSHLLFGASDFISSAEGVQQGDPLGPALFSLVLQALILKIDDECNLDLNCWYLDDGVLIGTPIELQKVVNIISNFGAGVFLNPKKCELFSLHESTDLSNLPSDFLRSPHLDILGSPITDVINFARKRLQKVYDTMEELLNMDHMQSAFILFKNCFGPMKINNLLRTVSPTTEFRKFLNEWDSSHSEMFSRIIRYPLSPNSLRQSSLPTKMGGLGLRSAYHISLGAFLASITTCIASQSIKPDIFTASENLALSDFNKLYQQNLSLAELQSNVSSEIRLQKFLSTKTFESIHDEFFNSLTTEDKIWITNCKSDSTSWFSSPPIASKGLLINNSTFQISILERLQANLFSGRLYWSL
jgi:hypothetical protein